MHVIRLRIPGVLALVAGLGMSVGVVLPTGAADAPTTYTVTDLGIPGTGVSGVNGDPFQPPPPGINSSGEVAGSYSTSTSAGAFLWQNGTFTDLGTLRGGSGISIGFTINNNTQIVGTSEASFLPCNTENAFLWQAGTGMTNLEDHPNTCGYISEAHGINTAGVAVGRGQRNTGYTSPLVFSGGAVGVLSTPCCQDSPSHGVAEAINDSGQIVGWGPIPGPGSDMPLLWQSGNYTVLGSLGGLDGSGRALAINAAGQVIGWSVAPNGRPHAFLWQNGTMTDLGTLQGTDSIAYGINSSGVVVGHSVDFCPGAPCGPNTAFIYENGVMLDLNDLIPAGSGVHLRTAGGINDSGQIVAVSDVPNAHAFLLTPVVAVATPTTTTVSSSQNPSVFGQSATFTATVSPVAPGTGTPTGTVTFKDGATTLGTATLSGGTAAFSTSTLGVGSHSITAEYGGDPNFAASTSAALTQVVNKANTTTTITSDTPDPSLIGQPYTVSWTVTVNAPGAGTPTGNVTVSDGTGATCQAAVAAGSCALTSTSVGAKTLTATYSSDSNFNGSSASTAHTVSYAVKLLYDPAKPTNTITLQLRDGNGVNVSAPSIVLTVQAIDMTPQSGTFTYQKTMGGQYKYGLPRNLAPGSHTLEFKAGSDPIVHRVSFTVR